MYYNDTKSDVLQTDKGQGRGDFYQNRNGSLIAHDMWSGSGVGSGICGETGSSICRGMGNGGGNIQGAGVTHLDFNK